MTIKLPANLSLKPAAALPAGTKPSRAQTPAVVKNLPRSSQPVASKAPGTQTQARSVVKAAPAKKTSRPVAFLSLLKPAARRRSESTQAARQEPATNAAENARQIVMADKKRRGEL